MASKGAAPATSRSVPFSRFDARDQRGEWCGAVGVSLGEGIVALA
jgi:hypothetical protein